MLRLRSLVVAGITASVVVATGGVASAIECGTTAALAQTSPASSSVEKLQTGWVSIDKKDKLVRGNAAKNKKKRKRIAKLIRDQRTISIYLPASGR